MRHSIVEGEPGIFPDPIARVLVSINRWVRRRSGKEQPPAAERPVAPESPGSQAPSAEGPPAAVD